MGKILPGVIVAFENPKGGSGKSTISALFAGYIHATGKDSNLSIGVIDIDDAQNTLGKMRLAEERLSESEIDDKYQIMNISSESLPEQIEYMKEAFDIILIDFPGTLKQPGVIECLMLVDIMIIPFEVSQASLDATMAFYEFYKEEILSKRTELGFKTTVRALPNRVVSNQIEYNYLLNHQENLPFKLLKHHIKNSIVEYQRNFSTIIQNYGEQNEDFGIEVVNLITEHLNK